MIYFITFIIINLLIIVFTFIFLKDLYVTDLYKPIDKIKKNIYFGQTIDLENNQVSIDYSIGFQLAFQSVNRKDGVNGYNLKIILYNDKYEPELASNNAKILIDYFNVLALIGPFGTPTTVQILSDCIKGRPIPLIGPFTASTVYRKQFNKYLILTNGSFELEFEITIENMLQNNIKNIGIIYQNDIYGSSCYTSFVNYILNKNLNLNIISTGTYERNTVEFDNCYKKLFNIDSPYDYNQVKSSKTLEKMDCIILFVAEKQISRILGYLKRIKPSLFIYYNCFVGTSINNYKELKSYNSNNIYQTLLGPFHLKENYPELYNKLLEEINIYEKNNAKIINQTQSLYQGFYTGLLIIDVLKKFPDLGSITRESFTDMFYSVQNFDVYGLKIGSFVNNKSNLGLNFVGLNKLVNDKLENIKIMNKNI
jgi:hypothetical protein